MSLGTNGAAAAQLEDPKAENEFTEAQITEPAATLSPESEALLTGGTTTDKPAE